MDKLTQDCCAARAAGMSYGKYMASKCASPQPSVIKKSGTNPPGLTGQQARPYCVRCGKPILADSKQRLYCGPMCRDLTNAERAHDKYLKKIGAQSPKSSTCPVCRKEFFTADRRKSFCSSTCANVARSERVQKYRKNKLSKENGKNGI